MVNRLLLISISLLTAGCWARPEISHDPIGTVDWTQVDEATEQAAIKRLALLDRSVFDEAWATLTRFSYSQDRSVSVRDQDGAVVGHATRTVDFSGPADRRTAKVTASDSSGAFESSLWSRFSDSGLSDSSDSEDSRASGDSRNPADEGSQLGWAQLVLPDDPLFLSERGSSFFRYAIVGDTLIGGELVTILETIVRPETSRQGVQWVRMFLDGAVLVGTEIFVAQQSMLYHELSNFRIMLAPIPSGEWLPHEVNLSSTVGLPFARSRSYEMHVAFRDIRPQ